MNAAERWGNHAATRHCQAVFDAAREHVDALAPLAHRQGRIVVVYSDGEEEWVTTAPRRNGLTRVWTLEHLKLYLDLLARVHEGQVPVVITAGRGGVAQEWGFAYVEVQTEGAS